MLSVRDKTREAGQRIYQEFFKGSLDEEAAVASYIRNFLFLRSGFHAPLAIHVLSLLLQEDASEGQSTLEFIDAIILEYFSRPL